MAFVAHHQLVNNNTLYVGVSHLYLQALHSVITAVAMGNLSLSDGVLN